jgi:hypothetical protein
VSRKSVAIFLEVTIIYLVENSSTAPLIRSECWDVFTRAGEFRLLSRGKVGALMKNAAEPLSETTLKF